MGNLPFSGVPYAEREELNLLFDNYPPWILTHVAMTMDVLCTPLQCRYSWRQYLPFGLGDAGGWFSEEFSTRDVLGIYPDPLTFEHFRELQQGVTVTPGTGFLAGLHGVGDLNAWFQALYEYLFHTPSTALCNLWTPTSLCLVFLLVVLIRRFKAFAMPRFQSWGRKLALEAHGEPWLKENEERIIKFGEYVFRLCYHSSISLVGFYYFWDAPWWDRSQGGTIHLYTNYPNQPVEPGMCWYYLFQASYNVDAMVSLLELSFQIKFFDKKSSFPISIEWSDTVRGDFNEMMAHHIVTNWLIFLSSAFRFTRIGSMVFWMHDISDVPVDMAKLANFVKWKTGTVASFALMCIVWLITRLSIFPFYIWASIYYVCHETVRSGIPRFEVYWYIFQPLFLYLLGVLILLHAVWFSMFIKMGIVLVSKGETHDLTEHKKGEKQDGPKGENGVAVNGSSGKKKTN